MLRTSQLAPRSVVGAAARPDLEAGAFFESFLRDAIPSKITASPVNTGQARRYRVSLAADNYGNNYRPATVIPVYPGPDCPADNLLHRIGIPDTFLRCLS